MLSLFYIIHYLYFYWLSVIFYHKINNLYFTFTIEYFLYKTSKLCNKWKLHQELIWHQENVTTDNYPGFYNTELVIQVHSLPLITIRQLHSTSYTSNLEVFWLSMVSLTKLLFTKLLCNLPSMISKNFVTHIHILQHSLH